jgi:hypothetical protein
MADTEAYGNRFHPSSKLSLDNQCIVIHPAEELMNCGSQLSHMLIDPLSAAVDQRRSRSVQQIWGSCCKAQRHCFDETRKGGLPKEEREAASEKKRNPESRAAQYGTEGDAVEKARPEVRRNQFDSIRNIIRMQSSIVYLIEPLFTTDQILRTL